MEEEENGEKLETTTKKSYCQAKKLHVIKNYCLLVNTLGLHCAATNLR